MLNKETASFQSSITDENGALKERFYTKLVNPGW
jgi:hypothetical protein